MNITTVSAAFKEKKATVMNTKVLRKVSEMSYVIGDESMVTILEVEENVKLNEDSFIKLVKPFIKKNVIEKNPKFNIVKGKAFDCTFEANDIEAACLASGKVKEELNLLDVESFATSKLIPCLTLKVCAVSKPYNGKFAEFRNVFTKDITGSKVTVVLYKRLKDSCEFGKVYDFHKLKKTDYKGQGEINCRLSSLSDTRVDEVFGERKRKFDSVNVGDDYIVGDFVGEYKNRLFNWSERLACAVTELSVHY